MPRPTAENKPEIAELRGLIAEKWPQACPAPNSVSSSVKIDSPTLNRLIKTGIPCGQMLDICGGASSGKTSFLFKLLSDLRVSTIVAYFDFSSSFHPAAAASCGNNIDHFLIVRPETLPAAIRTAEILLRQELANCLVFDLVGQTQEVPQILLHRLRQQTVRSRSLVIFLTENNSNLIPASMISLRLMVQKAGDGKIRVHVARSRISAEGITAEFGFDELQ